MISRIPALAAVLAAGLSLLIATDAWGARKGEQPGPRPISGAEAAAVEMVADFLERGPVAFHDRLAPESPLASLPLDEALAEIEARTGPPTGAAWDLQTVVPSLADRTAVFGVDFPSGVDDVVELNMVEHDGRYGLLMLRSLGEPSPYALRTSWMTAGEESDAPVLKTREAQTAWFAVLGGLIAILSIASLPIMRNRPLYGKLLIVVSVLLCAFVLRQIFVEIDSVTPQPDTASSGTEASPGFERIGALVDERRHLAAGVPMQTPSNLGEAAEDIASIWKAQAELRDLRFEDAQATLARFPITSDRPMVALLRARLAASAYDEVGSSLAYERAMRLGPGRDALWFETAQWLYALGFESRALGYLDRLPEMGSRHANVYYALASISGSKAKKEEAVAHLKTAWKLEPIPRSEIVATPSLTAVMRLEEARNLVPFSAAVEPRFRTDGDPARYVDLPEGAEVTVTGSSVSIALGGDRTLTVDGGAVLTGPDTTVADALAIRRRDEARSLDDLEQLLAFRGEPSALAHPAVRERFLRTATALASRNRWADLDRLTASLSASAEGVPPDLLLLRGTALRKLDRESEARRLLATMVASPSMERRSDPRILYQLGEMLAAMELYAPAIRTLERVDAMMDDVSLDDRIRQLSMNQRLAERYSELLSPNFAFHYPDDLDIEAVRRLSVVMEAELARLKKILPLSQFRRTTVNVLWWNEFRSTYTGSDHILGFYDGKITLPLAGVSSMEPRVVALVTHELAHAVIAQATSDHASAWLQEGLAQRFEMVPYHANAFNMYETDRLLPISLLNPAISESVDGDLVGQAYITSQTAIRFLEAKFGPKIIPSLITLLREGESEEDALARLTGLPLEELEARFREWGQSERRVFENRDIIRYDSSGAETPGVRFSKRTTGTR